ncbi:MAG TPA: ornithine cyclodeaminase family protein [Thermoleophilia bacterium]|nr:ornithine cyclodeaminase family protein [Thermoleophilia bacterium]
MSGDALRYLTRAEIESLGIGPAEVVDALDAGLREKGRGAVVMPPKTTLHGPDRAFCQVLSAWLSDSGALGVKWVTIFPANAAKGLPAVGGLVVLSDASTGRPEAILDGGVITAWRTGASAALAARYLARPEVDCVGLLGCGVQGRASVDALAAELPGLRTVRCHDAVPAAAAAFVAEAPSRLPGVEVVVCDEPAAITCGAGVVVTAITMSEDVAPPLDAGRLEPGALAVALDYDAAWSTAAMAECARFYCDDTEQALATRAHGPRLQGIPETIAGDLGELAAGLVEGRRDPGERLFCLNLGLAVEDIVTARLVLERARERGVGTPLPI